MSEEIAKLIVSVEAQTAKFSRDMDVMGRKLDGFSKRQEMAAKRGGAAWGKLGAQLKVFATAYLGAALFRGIVTATKEAEMSLANLQNAVANNGAQAGKTAAELSNLATQLQGVSTFSDEGIQDAMALLLRFRDIGDFDNAIKATLDLAAALKIDLASAAKLVGKIMSDPNTGLASAKKAGVVFSEAQKLMITSMVEAGDKAKAQQYIFEQLQGTTVGAAAAMRDNFGGALEGLKNDFGNLLEEKSGMPGATQAINDFSAVLRDPDFKAGIDASLGFILTLLAQIIKGWGLLLGLIPQLSEKLNAVKIPPWLKKAWEATPIGGIAKAGGMAFDFLFPEVPEMPKPTTGAGGVSLIPGELDEDSLLANFVPTDKELSEAEKAFAKIQEHIDNLREQIDTFGASEAGAAAYSATMGKLSKVFEAAGPAAEPLRQQYIAMSVELETLKQKTEAQTKAEEEAAAVKEEVAAALEGLKTNYDLASDAVDKYVGWLQKGLITEEQFYSLIKQTGDALAEQAKKSSDAAEEMTIQWDQALRNMQDILADTLFNSFEGGVKDMVYQWANALKRMASEALAANIFGLLTAGAGSGGSGFSLGGFLGAIFGGFTGGGAAAGAGGGAGASFAASGGVREGWTMVGERGRELVNFNSPSMVLPNYITEKVVSSAAAATASESGGELGFSAAAAAAAAGASVMDFSGFDIPMAASGGSFREGEWAIVGERGRELVNFNSPSMVLPNRATEEIMVSANGGARPINVYFDVTTPDADSFMRSRTQIEARMSTALNRASARNN